MNKKIIGVVGKKLSGKGTFGTFVQEILAPRNVVLVSFSDVLRDTLSDWGLPVSRHNLQRLAIIMNHEFGEGTLTRAVLLRLKNIDTDIVVIDGIRWLSDRDILRQIPGFQMVYITADIKVRYARRKAGQKVGEAEVPWEQFLKEEHAETEVYIEDIGQGAEYTIENNGTEEEFRAHILDFSAQYEDLAESISARSSYTRH